MTSQTSFWRRAVIYQIYPWTFNEDDNNNPQKGNGTLRGIAEKLPYLRHDVGVDALWLSPFYPSPMVDGGYDISDLVDVNPDIGTLEDFDELVQEAHKHNIRLMVDFIPNHTSDQHDWFQKSRRHEGYDDWYIWHPGHIDENGKRWAPNNWACVFSIPNREARARGEMPWLRDDEWTPPISAWTFDEVRGEYYLHSFAKEQPDLNWSNPLVREAMKEAMRFWLNRGVDGFRVDAVNHIGKNMDLPDEQVNTAYNEAWYDNPYDELLRYHSAGYPEKLHSYVWEMTQVLQEDEYADRDLRMILEAYMGESDLRDIDAIAPNVASSFNFGAFSIDWNAQHHKIQLDYYYERLQKKAVANQVNGNHDKPRLATRIGDTMARAAGMMNLFLPGMRFVYNGEELGLRNADIPHERLQDPNGLRDGERTPMIWDDTQPNGGFSTADPVSLWLPANQADMDKSVTRQKQDSLSSLTLYKSAIDLCQDRPALERGSYVSLHASNDKVLAYGRNFEDDNVIVLTNFTHDEQHTTVYDSTFVIGQTVLSSVTVKNDLKNVDLRTGIVLQPAESVVIIPA